MRLNEHSGACDIDDAVQDAMVGLIDAASKFEQNGTPFRVYAYGRICGEVRDGRRRMDEVSRRARAFQRVAVRELERAEATEGRAPSWSEVAERLGVDHADVGELLRQLHPVSSLDKQYLHNFDDSSRGALGRPLEDTLADRRDERERDLWELRELLDQCLCQLPAKLQFVLRCYYELDLTLAEVAECFGFTESRASQLHHDGLRRLRLLLPARP
jgi:RNA polymerase sigma factor (sigma-70 family)